MATLAANLDFQPRRRSPRLRVGIPAALATLDGRQAISLVDLSESGARLQVRDPQALSGGILKWLNFEAFGTVVWRAGQTVGLQFEDPIDSAWVLATRELLPALPGGKAELRRFARDWVAGGAPREERALAATARAQSAASGASETAPRRPALTDWLRAGKPFIAGGVLVGIVVGYWSTFF